MNISKVVLFIASTLFSASSYAATADIKVADSQVGLQGISTNVDYTETGNGIFGSPTGTLDTETGSVRGFALFASRMWGANNNYLEARYSRNNGHTNYTGALIGGGPFGSVVGQSGATFTDFNLRYGRGIAVDDVETGVYDQALVVPYFEFGYHRWDRGVNYGEIYTHEYLGGGLMGQYSPTSMLVISANAMVGHTFNSSISVAGPGGFSGSLGNSMLYKYGLSLDLAITRSLHANFGIDYTRFKYGISGIYPIGGGYVAWEPDSSTIYTNYSVGLGYAF
jgi:hypothetical protein